MKRIIAATLIALIILSATMLAGCEATTPTLQDVMADYTKMLDGPLPENLRLTIYYIDPSVLTRVSISTDNLINFPGVKKIVVECEELKQHLERLKKLDASILQPVKEESYINARLHYVFETKKSGKILEVTISQIHGSVFINGIEVEDNPIFYELIDPFLTEEDRNILGY